MIDGLLRASAAGVAHRVWVISDLQQSQPAEARRCLTTALEDFRSLALPIDQVWYLGDAVEGQKLDSLREVTAMQVEQLGALRVPLRYVQGNHDFDYYTRNEHEYGAGPARLVTPFADAVRAMPAGADWRTIPSLDAFHFIDAIGDWRVVFFSDHADPQGKWVAMQGEIRPASNAALYPYSKSDYRGVMDRVAADGRPTILAAHYGLAGGNRASALLSQILPLPPNIRLHLYGHAHIGDGLNAGPHLYRKVTWVDGHDVPQIDIASLDDARGSTIRSVILELYRDHSLGVYHRDHAKKQWESGFVLEGR